MSRITLSANQNWRFYRGTPPSERQDAVARSNARDPYQADYDDSKWEVVALPHTVRNERLIASGGRNYQGEAWYRRTFTVTEETAGMDILFELEAAMQRVDAWLDGEPLGYSLGGFLPVGFDLTGKLEPGKAHVLALRVDNGDMPDVPPGKPQGALDFCYFGGLYRDAWLKASGKVRFSYAVHEGKPASGGLYVTYPFVSREKAQVNVKAHLLNHLDADAAVSVRVMMTAPDDGTLTAQGSTLTVPAGGDAETTCCLTVPRPMLWHPYHPHLYVLKAQLLDADGAVLDDTEERIGIRSVRFTTEGFFINGEKLFLSGANRHQDYAYIGFALPDTLQKRDAAALRKAGMIVIRTGHYPQDKAFMDACDELGMLCVVPTPGWQIHPMSVAFDCRSFENTRRLIRYNRNHPSAVLWEPILNETDYPAYFAEKQREIVREETGDGWCACDANYACSAEYPVNYSVMDFGLRKPLFVREYADNFTEQFGPSVTLRRVRRGGNTGFYLGGERAMLRSAQERFEDYYRLRCIPGLNGAAMWAGIDHNRGYDENEAPVGMLDLLRLPKFTYHIYAAQQDAAQAGPQCFVANYWTEDSPRDVTVYTNCDAVRLSLNGREIQTLTAAQGWANTPIYAQAAHAWRMGGVDMTHDRIPEGVHPPLTFPAVPFAPGELKAEALINGETAATHTVRTPHAPARLCLTPHWEGMETWIADGSDLLMVHVFVQDQNGTLCPGDEREVRFSVAGDAAIVGDGEPWTEVNPQRTEAGAGGVVLRAGTRAGAVTLTATAEGLEPASITLRTQPDTAPALASPAQIPPAVKPIYACDRKARFSQMNQMRTEAWYKLNMVVGKPVNASSYADGYPAENAAKGGVGQPWVAGDASMPQWWLCDFEKAVWIYGVTVFWQHDGLWYDYDIQVSDHADAWETIGVGHASGQSYVPMYLDEPVRKRFARILVRSVSGGVPAGINMVEFHGRSPMNEQ